MPKRQNYELQITRNKFETNCGYLIPQSLVKVEHWWQLPDQQLIHELRLRDEGASRVLRTTFLEQLPLIRCVMIAIRRCAERGPVKQKFTSGVNFINITQQIIVYLSGVSVSELGVGPWGLIIRTGVGRGSQYTNELG